MRCLLVLAVLVRLGSCGQWTGLRSGLAKPAPSMMSNVRLVVPMMQEEAVAGQQPHSPNTWQDRHTASQDHDLAKYDLHLAKHDLINLAKHDRDAAAHYHDLMSHNQDLSKHDRSDRNSDFNDHPYSYNRINPYGLIDSFDRFDRDVKSSNPGSRNRWSNVNSVDSYDHFDRNIKSSDRNVNWQSSGNSWSDLNSYDILDLFKSSEQNDDSQSWFNPDSYDLKDQVVQSSHKPNSQGRDWIKINVYGDDLTRDDRNMKSYDNEIVFIDGPDRNNVHSAQSYDNRIIFIDDEQTRPHNLDSASVYNTGSHPNLYENELILNDLAKPYQKYPSDAGLGQSFSSIPSNEFVLDSSDMYSRVSSPQRSSVKKDISRPGPKTLSKESARPGRARPLGLRSAQQPGLDSVVDLVSKVSKVLAARRDWHVLNENHPDNLSSLA